MESFNCQMKDYGDYVTVTVYGQEVKTGRSKYRKTKQQTEDEIRKIEEDSNLSDVEKLIKKAIVSQPKREQVRKSNRPRVLTRAERERFRDVIVTNFKKYDKFITLTYGNMEVTVDEASKDFENWIKRMRERYGDFKYLAVRSFQKRGTIHFHVLATLPEIPEEEVKSGAFQNIWGHGGVRIQKVYVLPFLYKKSRLQKYLMKNLAEFRADERSYGKRLFLESKNLEKPHVWKGNYEKLMEKLRKSGETLKEIEHVKFPVEYLKSMEITTYQVISKPVDEEKTT